MKDKKVDVQKKLDRFNYWSVLYFVCFMFSIPFALMFFDVNSSKIVGNVGINLAIVFFILWLKYQISWLWLRYSPSYLALEKSRKEIDEEKYKFQEKINQEKREKKEEENEEEATINLYNYIKLKGIKEFKYATKKFNPFLKGLYYFGGFVYFIVWIVLIYNNEALLFSFYGTMVPSIFIIILIAEYIIDSNNDKFKNRIARIIEVKDLSEKNTNEKYKDILLLETSLFFKECAYKGMDIWDSIVSDNLNLIRLYNFIKIILHLLWIIPTLFILIFIALPNLISLLANPILIIIILLLIIIGILLNQRNK